MCPMHTELRMKQHTHEKKKMNYACWITMGIGYWAVGNISGNHNNSGFRCTMKWPVDEMVPKTKRMKLNVSIAFHHHHHQHYL